MDSICKKVIVCIFSVSTMCNVFIEDFEPRESCKEDGNSPELVHSSFLLKYLNSYYVIVIPWVVRLNVEIIHEL